MNSQEKRKDRSPLEDGSAKPHLKKKKVSKAQSKNVDLMMKNIAQEDIKMSM